MVVSNFASYKSLQDGRACSVPPQDSAAYSCPPKVSSPILPPCLKGSSCLFLNFWYPPKPWGATAVSPAQCPALATAGSVSHFAKRPFTASVAECWSWNVAGPSPSLSQQGPGPLRAWKGPRASQKGPQSASWCCSFSGFGPALWGEQ